MVEAKEKKTEEDNSHMFKRFASHNPLVYDDASHPKAFEDRIWGMKKLFDALHRPQEWRVGFAVGNCARETV